MSWYTPVTPGQEFASTLVTGWVARTAGSHLLVPDACVDVLWLDTGDAVVCGPETTAWRVNLPPGTDAVGVRFQPGVAGSVLRFDARELAGCRVPVADVLGARWQRDLVQQVGDAHDPRARVAAMLRHVRRWQRDSREPDDVATGAARLLARHPGTSVAELADELALSARQLNRRCDVAFGYGPATLRRILRLQRFLRVGLHPAAPTDIAALAHAAGYTDQAHLSRDARTIAGASPRALLRGKMSDRYTTGLGLTGRMAA